MGGDGGTLNNSRHEHTKLRKATLPQNHSNNHITHPFALAHRASTTHCSLSEEPLNPPHIIADRLGQLYNKEAVLRHLLHRSTHPVQRGDAHASGDGVLDAPTERDGHVEKETEKMKDPLVHVRSLRRDTVNVTVVADASGDLMCPVTMRIIQGQGRFSLRWPCGCLVADNVPEHLASTIQPAKKPHHGDADASSKCIACGTIGTRIALGAPLHLRKALQKAIVDRRALARKSNQGVQGGALSKKRKRRASLDKLHTAAKTPAPTPPTSAYND